MSQTELIRERRHLLSTENQMSDGDYAKKNSENKEKIAFDVTDKLQQRGQKEGSKLCFRKMCFTALVHMDINGSKLKKFQHCTQNAIQVLHDLN